MQDCFISLFEGRTTLRFNLEGLRWRVFDATGQVLGRLASQILTIIQGNDKPTYAPCRDDGDICAALNAKDVCVTGRKNRDKYIGHLKERKVIRKAVLRMLPRNKLQMRPRGRRAMIRAKKKANQQEQGGNDKRKGKKREVEEELTK
ncbi:ribosomal protein [Salix suchowensis]|nr:ribosomal protein [Salix suchowensis]